MRAAQVHIYLPDAGHPARGLVRVIAKDSTDNFTGPTTRTWLDSGEPSSRTQVLKQSTWADGTKNVICYAKHRDLLSWQCWHAKLEH